PSRQVLSGPVSGPTLKSLARPETSSRREALSCPGSAMKTFPRGFAFSFAVGVMFSTAAAAAPPIPPSPCGATEKGNPVIVTWTLVAGATEYKVFRTGSLEPTLLVGTAPQGTNSFQ